MTRKDFELIARVARDLNPPNMSQRARRRYIGEAFMDALAAAYPSFNREKFMAAVMKDDA